MIDQFDIAITRSSLPIQVADRIQDVILSEALHPGDKLPAERLLAERLGVSRPVIREALQVLSVRGLVRIKPGCGTFIQEPTAQDAADYLSLYFKLRNCPGSLREFFEVRQVLETEAAGLAAERASEQDIAQLQETLATMQAEQTTAADYIAADLAFHLQLARAAHNEFLMLILGPFSHIWSQVISISAEAPGALQQGIRYHREVLECLIRRDAAGARTAMREHMRAALVLSELSQKAAQPNI